MSHLVLFALPARLEALGEQGAKNLDYDPEHTGTEQNKDEHEHQHNSGGDKKLDHWNTSHKIFQIVEQEAAQRIGKATNDAPFEMVKMLHSHVLFPLEPVPPAAKTAVQVSVKLKVHIQRTALR